MLAQAQDGFQDKTTRDNKESGHGPRKTGPRLVNVLADIRGQVSPGDIDEKIGAERLRAERVADKPGNNGGPDPVTDTPIQIAKNNGEDEKFGLAPHADGIIKDEFGKERKINNDGDNNNSFHTISVGARFIAPA